MTCHFPTHRRRAFTLIEIMVVCAIIGIIITISIPAIYRQLHPESMHKAVRDVLDACEQARMRAVLEGTTATLIVRPAEKRLEVVVGHAPATDRLESLSVSGEEWRMPVRPTQSSGGSSFSRTLGEKIRIEAVRFHLRDFTDAEEVPVNFYRDGTSDEFSIALINDRGEQRFIFLDVPTATADFEVDPLKFEKR